MGYQPHHFPYHRRRHLLLRRRLHHLNLNHPRLIRTQDTRRNVRFNLHRFMCLMTSGLKSNGTDMSPTTCLSLRRNGIASTRASKYHLPPFSFFGTGGPKQQRIEAPVDAARAASCVSILSLAVPRPRVFFSFCFRGPWLVVILYMWVFCVSFSTYTWIDVGTSVVKRRMEKWRVSCRMVHLRLKKLLWWRDDAL